MALATTRLPRGAKAAGELYLSELAKVKPEARKAFHKAAQAHIKDRILAAKEAAAVEGKKAKTVGRPARGVKAAGRKPRSAASSRQQKAAATRQRRRAEQQPNGAEHEARLEV